MLVACTVAPSVCLFACSSSPSHSVAPTADGGSTHGTRPTGQSDFISAPAGGSGSQDSQSGLSSNGSSSGGGATVGGGTSAAPVPGTKGGAASNGSTTTTRTVEETDIYRFDASTNRLYYLNSYRGLMVFDVTNIDSPQLLGRAPIFGNPVDMVVRGTIVAVIIGDWYGTAADGTPFHGSVVRGYDTTDPTNIAKNGEADLRGWVRDSRVVADPTSASGVLYTVSEDYGWYYGWDVSGVYSSNSTPAAVVVSSVSFGPAGIQKVDEKAYSESNNSCYYYSGGSIFNVTDVSIMLASTHSPSNGGCVPPTQTDLTYLDITDYGGTIVQRGTITVNGVASGWGADNGRWNLDFADKFHAHVIGTATNSSYYYGYGSTINSYLLETADFTNPDAPTLSSELSIPAPAWGVTARFDTNRMYLSASDVYYYSGTSSQPLTPVQIYDLSNPAAPALAGQTQIPGSVWLFMPSGNQIFALGQQYTQSANGYYGSSQVSLSYLNVASATSPSVIGTAAFGNGWAWTPAADTFKAFTEDDTQGLVVLPFSSWNYNDYQYFDGVQLIQFTPPTTGNAGSIATSGTARTKGWVERGIFVKNRLVSLSDLTLAVVDYTNLANPVTVTELTLARNVVDATPQTSTIAELSSDWWGNDTTSSALRLRPISDPEEIQLNPNVPEVDIAGVNARVFHNADASLAYVVTSVQTQTPCSSYGGAGWTQQVQVVDQSGATPVLRGSVSLPLPLNWCGGYYYWDDFGWGGFWYYDWYNGNNIVQVGDHMLAFRRWIWTGVYDDSTSALFVVDMSNPDSPTIASTTITRDTTAWWGNMRAVGDTLYTTHYDWYTGPVATGSDDAGTTTYGTRSYVRYYLDRIDLTDPTHPVVGSSINVPGVLVGANATDPSVLYTMDYFWDTDWNWHNELSAVQIQGDKAYLLSSVSLAGWVGRVVTQNDVVYMSVESDAVNAAGNTVSTVQLHQVDMTNPSAPVDSASAAQGGWGWLMDVQGDRAFVSSGWGQNGIDIYRLAPGTPPVFDQFVRTLGWSPTSLRRQGNTVYVSTGYWGVQAIALPPAQ